MLKERIIANLNFMTWRFCYYKIYRYKTILDFMNVHIIIYVKSEYTFYLCNNISANNIQFIVRHDILWRLEKKISWFFILNDRSVHYMCDVPLLCYYRIVNIAQ